MKRAYKAVVHQTDLLLRELYGLGMEIRWQKNVVNEHRQELLPSEKKLERFVKEVEERTLELVTSLCKEIDEVDKKETA